MQAGHVLFKGLTTRPLLLLGTQSRYQVKEFPDGGALLRIEPVKAGRDDATYECVAENGVGDAVSAEATLTVFEGESCLIFAVDLY